MASALSAARLPNCLSAENVARELTADTLMVRTSPFCHPPSGFPAAWKYGYRQARSSRTFTYRYFPSMLIMPYNGVTQPVRDSQHPPELGRKTRRELLDLPEAVLPCYGRRSAFFLLPSSCLPCYPQCPFWGASKLPDPSSRPGAGPHRPLVPHRRIAHRQAKRDPAVFPPIPSLTPHESRR